MGNRVPFIYIIKPYREEMLVDFGTAEEEAIISQHLQYVQNLAKDGIAALIGRTLTLGPDGMGMVIFYAEDIKEAHEIMSADPAIILGVMSAELYPFRLSFMAQNNNSV